MKIKLFLTIKLLLTFATLFMLVGCSKPTAEESKEDIKVDVEASEYSTREGNKEIEVLEDSNLSESDVYTVTDMAGRQVEIPLSINKVCGVNNNSSIMIYTLAPEKLIGWNTKLGASSKKYLDTTVANLPILGSLYGNSTKINLEGIIEQAPDVIIFTDSNMSDDSIVAADELQNQLSIPFLVVSTNIDDCEDAYRFLGKILDKEEKAMELIAYYSKTFDDIMKIKNNISEEDVVTVYYARGEDGLTTEVQGSNHAKLLDLVGAKNVVSKDSLVSSKPIVSIEQVMTLNPEVILIGNTKFAESGSINLVEDNVGWKTIDAVMNDRVYTTPFAPFSWFDRPPSVNRIIGMRWLMYILYPEVYEGDIEEEIKEFFELFYHVSITDKDVKKFLGE